MSGRVWLWCGLLLVAVACEGKDRAFGPASDPGMSVEGNEPGIVDRDGGDSSTDDPGNPTVSGAAILTAMPERIDFGAVPIGFAAPARVEFLNSGNVAASIAELMLSADSTEFVITRNDCTTAIAPMATCSVSLAFQPAQVGSRSALLQAVTEASTTVAVPLGGEGLESSPFILEAAPESSTSFGDVLVNTERIRAFRLTNPTAQTSSALDFSVSHPAFSLVTPDGMANGCLPQVTTLAGGASCDIQVRFAPLERGPVEATLTVRIGNAATSLNLNGNALIPAVLLVSSAELDFGSIERLGTATLEVVVQNAGDQDLASVTGAISGPQAAEFTIISNGCSQPIVAGGSCNVSVSFTPAQSGERTAILGLDGGAAGSFEVTLAGRGVEPGDLVLSAADGSSTNFGSVLLGASRQQTFRVTNPGEVATGTIDFTLNSSEFSLVPASGSDCVPGSTNLMGGGACDIRVRFSPSQRQQRNATLTVSSESLGSKSMNLSGVGLAPASIDAITSMDFGRIAQGSSSTRTVVVENSGDELLGAVTTSLSGQHQGDFVVEGNDCTAGLGADDGCEVFIEFTPRGTGSRLATLRLQGTPGGVREVRLQGVGLIPGALALAPAQGSSSEFTMPLVLGAGQSQTQTFVLTNTGEVASGTINIAALNNGFQVLNATGTDCRSNTTNLEGGATCTIRVQFTPAVRGTNSASLSVGSQNAGSASLGLRGTGLSAAQLTVDPLQLTFAETITVGQSALATLTLRNNGDVAGTSPTTQIVGPNAPEFTIATTTCGASIAGAGTCALTIEFAPNGSGSRAATLRLRGSAVFDVTLSGRGVLGNGQACTTNSQCASARCDGACCAGACNGPCRACRVGTGACDVMPADDAACDDVECTFDEECVTSGTRTISSNLCRAFGECKTEVDCEFTPLPERTACGDVAFEICDGAGSCVRPDVQCGLTSCEISADTTCCQRATRQGSNTSVSSTCQSRTDCPATILTAQPVAATPLSCDEPSDCQLGEVCCLAAASGGSDSLCRAESGCNRSDFMVQFYEVCLSPQYNDPNTCPTGSTCNLTMPNFPDWRFCTH